MKIHRMARLIGFGVLFCVAGLTVVEEAHAIKRCEVLKRAQAWVDDPNAWYSWSATYTDPTTGVCCYRPDCSGMVSAVWGLPPPGHTTYSFAGGPWDDGVSYVISAGDLKPGDAVNFPGNPSAQTGHIMLYVSGDFNSGRIEVMEEYQTGKTAERHWKNINTGIYLPIRYKNIEDDGPEICNGVDDNCNGLVDEGDVCETEAVFWGASIYAPARTTDVNGDGKADVCARSSAGLACHLSEGNKWGKSTPIIESLSDKAGWTQPKFFSTFRYGDVNGDGKADVCARAAAGMVCWKSNGSAFVDKFAGPIWSDDNGWGVPQHYSTIRLLDFDGDGKDDICARAGVGMVCHKSTGSGFGPQIAGPAWSNSAGNDAPRHYSTLRTGDVNGDGKDDLCMRTKAGIECFLSNGNGFPTKVAGPTWSDANGWGKPYYYTTIRLADINGDRKADICARTSIALVCHMSLGTSFGPSITVDELSDKLGWTNEGNYTTLRTDDIDGDGKHELCIRAHSGMLCYRWKDSKFERFNGPAFKTEHGWGNAATYFTLQMADITGDNKADICGRHSTGFLCYPSQGSSFAAAIPSVGYADAQGWNSQKYASTIAVGGPLCIPKPEKCNGVDDDCDGVVDEGCPGPDAGAGGGSTGGSGGGSTGGSGGASTGGAGGSAGSAVGGAAGVGGDTPAPESDAGTGGNVSELDDERLRDRRDSGGGDGQVPGRSGDGDYEEDDGACACSLIGINEGASGFGNGSKWIWFAIAGLFAVIRRKKAY